MNYRRQVSRALLFLFVGGGLAQAADLNIQASINAQANNGSIEQGDIVITLINTGTSDLSDIQIRLVDSDVELFGTRVLQVQNLPAKDSAQVSGAYSRSANGDRSVLPMRVSYQSNSGHEELLLQPDVEPEE